MVFVVIGAVLIGISFAFRYLKPQSAEVGLGAAPWVVAYLVGMGVLSYVGAFPGTLGAGGDAAGSGIINGIWGLNHTLVGGKGTVVTFWWGLLLVVIFSLIIYFWAVYTALPEAKVDEYVKDVYPPPVTSH